MNQCNRLAAEKKTEASFRAAISASGLNALEVAAELRDLTGRASRYSKMSDNEKLEFHRDLAQKINKYGPNSELSRKLTEEALGRITEIHKRALNELDRKLKEIAAQHQNQASPVPASKGSSSSDELEKRLQGQKERHKDADRTNAQNEARMFRGTRFESDSTITQQHHTWEELRTQDKRYREDLDAHMQEVAKIRREVEEGYRREREEHMRRLEQLRQQQDRARAAAYARYAQEYNARMAEMQATMGAFIAAMAQGRSSSPGVGFSAGGGGGSISSSSSGFSGCRHSKYANRC